MNSKISNLQFSQPSKDSLICKELFFIPPFILILTLKEFFSFVNSKQKWNPNAKMPYNNNAEYLISFAHGFHRAIATMEPTYTLKFKLPKNLLYLAGF